MEPEPSKPAGSSDDKLDEVDKVINEVVQGDKTVAKVHFFSYLASLVSWLKM